MNLEKESHSNRNPPGLGEDENAGDGDTEWQNH